MSVGAFLTEDLLSKTLSRGMIVLVAILIFGGSNSSLLGSAIVYSMSTLFLLVGALMVFKVFQYDKEMTILEKYVCRQVDKRMKAIIRQAQRQLNIKNN
jgi:hypothetical protein